MTGGKSATPNRSLNVQEAGSLSTTGWLMEGIPAGADAKRGCAKVSKPDAQGPPIVHTRLDSTLDRHGASIAHPSICSQSIIALGRMLPVQRHSERHYRAQPLDFSSRPQLTPQSSLSSACESQQQKDSNHGTCCYTAPRARPAIPSAWLNRSTSCFVLSLTVDAGRASPEREGSLSP